MLVYEIMRSLYSDGKIEILKVETPGAFEGYSTEKFKVCLK